MRYNVLELNINKNSVVFSLSTSDFFLNFILETFSDDDKQDLRWEAKRREERIERKITSPTSHRVVQYELNIFSILSSLYQHSAAQ
jgi:hypothetical protein